jgi:hypothetical protein
MKLEKKRNMIKTRQIISHGQLEFARNVYYEYNLIYNKALESIKLRKNICMFFCVVHSFIHALRARKRNERNKFISDDKFICHNIQIKVFSPAPAYLSNKKLSSGRFFRLSRFDDQHRKKTDST